MNAFNTIASFETAKKLLQVAKSSSPDAMLMGIKSREVMEFCQHSMYLLIDVDPMLIFHEQPVLFWVCPNGCRGIVTWDNGVAVCGECGTLQAAAKSAEKEAK
jgi:hypothetical protein